MSALKRGLHRADLDLRSPVSLAGARHRSGVDVEDVAGLLGQVADVFQIGALLAGNLIDGQGNEKQDAGDDQRDHAEECVLEQQQRNARLRGQGGKWKAAPVATGPSARSGLCP